MTIRPGRPLLVPIHHRQHFVLLVIQLGEDAEITCSILDSKTYHLNRADREAIHARAWRIARRCGWLTHVFADGSNSRGPWYTTWIPASQQPSDDECGYYTILNAWTLALGLRPDPDARLDWTGQFFSDLKNVIHLTRLHHADWKLIYAFLKCQGFVLDGHVPLDRQFHEIVQVPSKGDKYLKVMTQSLWYLEQAHYAENPTLDLEELRAANVCELPGGRRHTEAIASDYWDDVARAYAGRLARCGIHNNNLNKDELNVALGRLFGQGLRHQLKDADLDYRKQSPEQLLPVCREHLKNLHRGLLMGERPCEVLDDALRFYDFVFDPKFLDESLRSEGFQDYQRCKKGGRWKRGFEPSEINLAIAAVVEAIDRRQRELYRKAHPDAGGFAGGFTLATSNDQRFALNGFKASCSRPRRCWLLPISVLDKGLLNRLKEWREKHNMRPLKRRGESVDGHHLLAVVQENRDGEVPCFEVYFYDSATRILGDSYPFLFREVLKAAVATKWSTHRNADKRVRFTNVYHTVPVPQQATGGWQCGWHVVINAWILAMGLQPADKVEFTDLVYREFYLLARAAVCGLLDWQVLVAWFFCHNLTVEEAGQGLSAEQKLVLIREDKRFENTESWRDENELQKRISWIRGNEDNVLEAVDVNEQYLPYDFSNNIVLQEEVTSKDAGESSDDSDSGESDAAVADSDVSFESSDSDFNDPLFRAAVRQSVEEMERKSLKRSYDEPSLDLHHPITHRQRLRKPKKGNSDALHFLAGYNADGDVQMRDNDARSVECSERRDEVDKLFFLDAY